MKTKKIYKAIEDLLSAKQSGWGHIEYKLFGGDGEYRLYNCDLTQNVWLKAKRWLVEGEDYKVVGKGNIAPRGGKWGATEKVEFLPKFYEKYGWFIDEEKKRAEAVLARQAREEQDFVEKVDSFKAWAEAHPEEIAALEAKIKERTADLPSKKRSNKAKLMRTHVVDKVLGTNSWTSWKIYEQATFNW